MRFAEWTSGEEQRVGRSGGRAVTERNGPQAVDRDRRAVGGVQLAPRPQLAVAAEMPGVEGVDVAIAEVAHEQVSAERPEIGGGDR